MSTKLWEKKEVFLCPFCGAPYRELIPAGTVQVKCRYCGATVLVPPRLGGALQRCPNHPESLAVGACNGCAGNFCGDCLFLVDMLQYQQQLSRYSYFCSKCIKEKRLKGWSTRNQEAYVAAMLLAYLFTIPILFFSPAAGFVFFILFIAMIAAVASSGEKFSWPTMRMVTEKMAELNARAENIKASIGAEELENLYTKISVGTEPFALDAYSRPIARPEQSLKNKVEEYMSMGLNRKEAILKLASEQGIEIRPGLHIPPAIEDALAELKEEIKKSELVRIKEEAERIEKPIELYENLLYTYRRIYGSGAQSVLDKKIASYVKKGMDKNEAIRTLARKEGLLPKEK